MPLYYFIKDTKPTREVEPLRGMDKKIEAARQQIEGFYKDRMPGQDSAISAHFYNGAGLCRREPTGRHALERSSSARGGEPYRAHVAATGAGGGASQQS